MPVLTRPESSPPIPSSGSPAFDAVLARVAELHRKKSHDYGIPSDPFANVRAAAEFGIAPWLGVAVRMNDKMSRIKSMAQNGRLLNESLEDSFFDLAVYGLIAVILLAEEMDREKQQTPG